MSLIARLLDIVITPCLVESDSCSLQSRKVFVIAFAGIAFNALLVGLPITVINGIYDPTAGKNVVGACLFQMTVTCSIFPYLYLRITKSLPAWLPDLQMWGTVPITLTLTLFTHQGSVVMVSAVISLVAIVLQIRGWFVLLIYTVLIIVFHALINDFAEEIPILHETFSSTELLPNKCMWLVGNVVTPLLLMGLGLYYIMDQFSERMNQADAAIAMNLAVADKLRRYDTDGVAEILAANRGKVDEKLLEAFTAIQHNLQEYRPHIPDYIIAATTTEPTEDSQSGEDCVANDDDDEGDHSFKTSDSGNCRSHSRHKSILGSSSSVEIFDASTSRRSRPSSNYRHRVNNSNSNSASVLATSGVDSNAPHLMGDSSGVGEEMATSKISSSNGRGGKAGKQGGTAKVYTGQATTVFIRFVAGACGSLRSCDGTVPRGPYASTVVEYLGLGVEAAAKHAKLHGGAMQYMQGCGLMVSFNAASRVNSHETKACAFALGLKDELDALPNSTLTLHATIVTTPVMSFFAGNGGQLMLTVLGGFMPIHTALHHYLSQAIGDDVSCILIGKSSLPTVELHYEARMLGVVGMTPGSQEGGHASSTFNISADAIQLLCPRKATESDEWMYELENQTSTHGFTSRIVGEATSGDLKSAMRIVSEHEAAIHNDTLLSRCLRDRIESCIEDSTAFPLHTAPPTKMW